MGQLYAAVSPDGEVLGVEGDKDAAVAVAARDFPSVIVSEEDAASSGFRGFGDLGNRASSYEKMPDAALRASGLRPTTRAEVMAISPQEAHAELLALRNADGSRLFPEKKWVIKRQQWEPLKVFDEVTSAADSLIGENYKTAKGAPENPLDMIPPVLRDTFPRDRLPSGRPALVKALSLLPHSLASGAYDSPLLPPTETGQKGLGFCVGSTAACRASCLVYSGQNQATEYNVQVKRARSIALLQRPLHFMRLLTVAIHRHFCGAIEEPFFRLNTYSGIPWETVAPWLFDEFPANSFYDYTKVPNRRLPGNYDMTFSWSGENEEFAIREVEQHGRRVAVVFLLAPDFRNSKKTSAHRSHPLPLHFKLGRGPTLPVVDGDVSDVRPRNPGACVVGLRWKNAVKQDVNPETSPFVVKAGKYLEGYGAPPAPSRNAFVVPVREVDGWLVAAETPAMTPRIDPDLLDDEDVG